MATFTREQFERVKRHGEEFYKDIESVRCPYFPAEISFSAKGLEHLKFKKKNHARSSQDQYVRFRLLRFAPDVLKLSRTVQGISERKVFELNRSNHRNEHVLVSAVFYEFIAVLENIRVKVIVRKLADGPLHFWSIIPYWKTDIYTGRRKLHTGNPEED